MKKHQKWLVASAVFYSVIGLYLWRSGTDLGLVLSGVSLVLLVIGFSTSGD